MEIEKINNAEISVKVYQGQRVVTFKDIDTVHERPEGTARKRFNDNRKHFIESEDYYKISPSEFRTAFQLDMDARQQNDITLITESGYLMLVKSFTDDLAWGVQRQLVKSYFRKKQPLYWQETRQAAKENRISETDSIKVFVAYAKQQGSQHADRYYYHLTDLAHKAAGITEGRDKADIQQLNNLTLIEHIISEVLRDSMGQEKPYKEIYLDCRERIEQFEEIAYLGYLAKKMPSKKRQLPTEGK